MCNFVFNTEMLLPHIHAGTERHEKVKRWTEKNCMRTRRQKNWKLKFEESGEEKCAWKTKRTPTQARLLRLFWRDRLDPTRELASHTGTQPGAKLSHLAPRTEAFKGFTLRDSLHGTFCLNLFPASAHSSTRKSSLSEILKCSVTDKNSNMKKKVDNLSFV